MNELSASEKMKALYRTTFDTVADGYGSDVMRFFHQSAQHLPTLLALGGHETVLDVACGTGIPSRAIAKALPQGKVVGVDFSPGMLGRAQQLNTLERCHNIELKQMDMTSMTLPNRHYDAANCSFGIFFVEDMVSLLDHIGEKVRPGGTVLINSFCDDSFSPLAELFFEHIRQFGVVLPAELGWKRIGTQEKVFDLFASTRLTDIETSQLDVSYHLQSAEQWWEIIWYAGFRGLLSQLDEAGQQAFKAHHLQAIDRLRDEQGIHLNIELLFGRARVN